jgi:hypothetical protein
LLVPGSIVKHKPKIHLPHPLVQDTTRRLLRRYSKDLYAFQPYHDLIEVIGLLSCRLEAPSLKTYSPSSSHPTPQASGSNARIVPEGSRRETSVIDLAWFFRCPSHRQIQLLDFRTVDL